MATKRDVNKKLIKINKLVSGFDFDLLDYALK